MMKSIQIGETANYSIFKRLKGNRDVTNKRVAIIKASIENIGYISNPIIVNEDMEVIDGQGRLEALRQLDIPVEYRIIDGIGIEECRAMNLKPTSWTIEDFIHSYSEYGNENYIRLKKLHEQYGYGYSALFSLSRHITKSGGASQEELRNGTYELSEDIYRALHGVCSYLDRFKDIQKKVGGRSDLFYICIGWCAMQPNVDIERLAVSIHQQAEKLSPFGRTEDSLRQISEIYNHGYPKKNRRFFDYEWKIGSNNAEYEQCEY